MCGVTGFRLRAAFPQQDLQPQEVAGEAHGAGRHTARGRVARRAEPV
jgi:hypothetical protein